MVEIRGFQGFVFDPDKTGTPDAVLTPPYDVIGPEERVRLAASGPYNMTHLMLPEAAENRSPYENAAALLTAWTASGALKQDAAPGLYLLRQRFTSLDGAQLERKAFFALLRLPEQGEQFILGHERTFDSPVEDRLALMRATRANLEPIFVMYADPVLALTSRLFACMETAAPVLRANTSDGVLQELWRGECTEDLVRHIQGQTLYIADGHHRFRTACLYRDECRAAGMPAGSHDFVMAGFVAFEDPGLRIYAAHRVVPAAFNMPFASVRETLAPWFSMTPVTPGIKSIEALRTLQNGCHLILHAGKDGAWQLTLDESRRDELLATDRGQAWKNLDVAVLHRGILERLLGVPTTLSLIYEKDDKEAFALVDRGEASMAFLLRPTRSDQVRDCAESFEPMPQKSTYYFPKMPSGAVMHVFG